MLVEVEEVAAAVTMLFVRVVLVEEEATRAALLELPPLGQTVLVVGTLLAVAVAEHRSLAVRVEASLGAVSTAPLGRSAQVVLEQTSLVVLLVALVAVVVVVSTEVAVGRPETFSPRTQALVRAVAVVLRGPTLR